MISAARDRVAGPTRALTPTAMYCHDSAIGMVSPRTVLANPIMRNVETARMTETIDQTRLCRVVRGAPRKAKAITTNAIG